MTETELLFDLLEKGVSPAHVVSACAKRLEEAGFLQLDLGACGWHLFEGGKYFINHNETTLFVFTLPKKWDEYVTNANIRIAAAHTG